MIIAMGGILLLLALNVILRISSKNEDENEDDVEWDSCRAFFQKASKGSRFRSPTIRACVCHCRPIRRPFVPSSFLQPGQDAPEYHFNCDGSDDQRGYSSRNFNIPFNQSFSARLHDIMESLQQGDG